MEHQIAAPSDLRRPVKAIISKSERQGTVLQAEILTLLSLLTLLLGIVVFTSVSGLELLTANLANPKEMKTEYNVGALPN